LKRYLKQKGYDVYPSEIVCGPIGCPHQQNRLVDVAARKGECFYAFEYKSARDYLPRALKQIENYRLSFDYVILVAEIPRGDVSVDPKRGFYMKKFLNLGVGLWTVRFRSSRSYVSKANLANVLKEISEKAPIESHEVGTSSDGKLVTNDDMWFWLFYSVMDRRSDASTFIHAREILEKTRLYHPFSIVKYVQEIGKEKVVRKIAAVLMKNDFPLLKDRFRGILSQPLSIVEAALFIAQYDFSFHKLYHTYKGESDALWKTLQKEIYGVGPRIASQFIRGMVLKGPWNFPLTDNRFLEECAFNIEIAARIGLIERKSDFIKALAEFANTYLEGNRGILSHALWYIRKRYCSAKVCGECPLFENCQTQSIESYELKEVVTPKRQHPIPENREWIKTKFLHRCSTLKILKNPLPRAQTKLSKFFA